MISLEDVEAEFPAKPTPLTVGAPNLRCEAGKAATLTGRNGSGKTTLLRVAAGSIRPRSGRVRVSRPCIAFTDIERQLHLRLTVRENLRLLAAPYGLSDAPRQSLAAELDRAGLGGRESFRAGKLSKGQKARLIAAFVATHDSRAVILDEPGNGLDAPGIAYLVEVLSGACERGAAVLIASHDRRLIRALGGDVYLADEARIFRRIEDQDRNLARRFEVHYSDGGHETVAEHEVAERLFRNADAITSIRPAGLSRA